MVIQVDNANMIVELRASRVFTICFRIKTKLSGCEKRKFEIMKISLNEALKCQACGDIIRGRSDKKFCNDYCRSSFNNKLKKGSHKTVRNINNALAKNRRILELLLPDGETSKKVTKEKLLQSGFQFKYLTQVYKTGNGNSYHFCYDYGYLQLPVDEYLIVRRKSE